MKWIRRIVLFLLLIILAIAGVFIGNGYQMYQRVLAQTSLEEKIKLVQEDEDYVTIKEVPSFYKNAIIAVEDRRFYEHGAIDPIGIARAIVTNFRSQTMREGGSTITQQVAKNLYFIEEDASAARKIAELFMAHQLEKEYEKDTIFELYMNTIYFGEGYYGIREASLGYFQKEPIDLDLYEATMLAGVPNAPSIYSPAVNLDLAKNRQNKVVQDMVVNGYLTQEQADSVLAEQKTR